MHRIIVEETRTAEAALAVRKLLDCQPAFKLARFRNASHLNLSAIRAPKR
jgi:hypothetical protein